MAKEKILLIEDDASTHRLAKTVLQFKGYEVVSAFTGKEGIERAAQEEPELIILDIRLPDMDGVEVLSRLKESEETKRMPVVMFTAYNAGQARQTCKRLGAVGYLTKPIEPLRFPSDVEKLLKELEEQRGSAEGRNGDLEDYEAMFAELQRDFIAEFPNRLARLHAYVKQKDSSAVQQFGHKLKGSGTSMGFEKLSMLGAQMEHEAEKGDWTQIERIFHELERTYTEIKHRVSH